MKSRPVSSQTGDEVQVWAKYMKLLNGTSASKAETYRCRQHESFYLKRPTFAGLTAAYRLNYTEGNLRHGWRSFQHLYERQSGLDDRRVAHVEFRAAKQAMLSCHRSTSSKALPCCDARRLRSRKGPPERLASALCCSLSLETYFISEMPRTVIAVG